MPTNSKAIGAICKMCSYPELCLVKDNSNNHNKKHFGTGYEFGHRFCSNNHAVLWHQTLTPCTIKTKSEEIEPPKNILSWSLFIIIF